MRVGEIQVILKLAYRGFQSALRGIRGQILSFKNSITSLGRGISRIFSSLFRVIRNVGIVAGIAFGAMIIAGARFEDAMNRTFAIISGGSKMAAAGMSALTEEARRLGRETLYSSTQAAKGMQVLALAGFNTREILKTIGPVLNMAIVGNIELAEASSIAITALRSFQMDASKTVRVSDILAKAAVSANITISSLGESLKYSAAVANAAGWSIEELTAAIGQMGNAGFQGSMAGSSLRRAISMMLSPTSQAQKIMNKLGLTFTDSTGKLKPFVEIISALEVAGIGAADMFKLFGLRAAPAMTAVVSMGVGSLTKLQKKLEDSAGTADKMSQKFRETIVGRFKDLMATVNELAITFTKAFGTSIADALFGMRNWLNEINDAIQAHGRLAKIIDSLKEGLSPLTEKFKELGQSMIDWIKDADFDAISKSIKEFVASAMTSVAKLIEFLKDVEWGALFKGLAGAVQFISDTFLNIQTAVEKFSKYISEDLPTSLAAGFAKSFNIIVQGLTKIQRFILPFLKLPIPQLVSKESAGQYGETEISTPRGKGKLPKGMHERDDVIGNMPAGLPGGMSDIGGVLGNFKKNLVELNGEITNLAGTLKVTKAPITESIKRQLTPEEEFSKRTGLGSPAREYLKLLADSSTEEKEVQERLLGRWIEGRKGIIDINQKIIDEIIRMNEAIATNTQQIGNAKVEDRAKNSNYLRNLKIGG